MSSETTRWIRSSQTAWQKVEDRVLVVTPRTRKIHILHGCAGELWDLLENPCTMEDLLRVVLESYEIDRDRAGEDVRAWVEELAKKEIIVSPDPAGAVPASPLAEEKISGH